MREYRAKSECERSVAEMAAAMEVGNGELLKFRAVEEEVTSSSKRRKVYDSHEADDELENFPANSASNSTTSSEELNDAKRTKMRSRDLKHMDSETEISTLNNIGQFGRETSPSCELCGVDSAGDMESSSTIKKKSSPRNSQYPKPSEIPSAAEIEEFFARAEMQEQKRFADKYNYDIVKDVPLEGRFEWIRWKP